MGNQLQGHHVVVASSILVWINTILCKMYHYGVQNQFFIVSCGTLVYIHFQACVRQVCMWHERFMHMLGTFHAYLRHVLWMCDAYFMNVLCIFHDICMHDLWVSLACAMHVSCMRYAFSCMCHACFMHVHKCIGLEIKRVKLYTTAFIFHTEAQQWEPFYTKDEDQDQVTALDNTNN